MCLFSIGSLIFSLVIFTHQGTLVTGVQLFNFPTVYRFPLFAKGSEKALFQYAVFLLNKDIAQACIPLL